MSSLWPVSVLFCFVSFYLNLFIIFVVFVWACVYNKEAPTGPLFKQNVYSSSFERVNEQIRFYMRCNKAKAGGRICSPSFMFVRPFKSPSVIKPASQPGRQVDRHSFFSCFFFIQLRTKNVAHNTTISSKWNHIIAITHEA